MRNKKTMKDGTSYMVTIAIKEVDKASVTAYITNRRKLNRNIIIPLTTFHHGFIHEEDIPQNIEIGSSFYAFFQREPPILWNICPKKS